MVASLPSLIGVYVYCNPQSVIEKNRKKKEKERKKEKDKIAQKV